MPIVFPGWYIKVARKSFLSKVWEVRFYDGLKTIVILPTALTLTKRWAEDQAQWLLEEICKTRLEECKQKQPEIFKEILSDPKTLWRTNGPMGDIPIGLIAQKLYPEETKVAKG
jgi:hypothetical protein